MKKHSRILTIVLSLACALAVCLTAAACDGGGENKTITYAASELSPGTINKAYTANIATAEGAEGIAYAVKSGSLPKGLTLSAEGVISGTPTEAAENVKFTVEASADKATSASAEFTLTIMASGGEFKFEAEYVNLDDVRGGLISGSIAGVNMIIAEEKASNGYYVGGTHKTGVEFKFVINAAQACKATIKVAMGTELGPITIKPSVLQLKVGSKTVNYKEFKIPEGENRAIEFKEYTLSPQVDLAEGDNVITFTVMDNTLCNGASGGPMFDCMTITAGSDLSWTPKTGNIE